MVGKLQQSELSIRDYAARRRALGLPGGSPWAVQKALKAGRITKTASGKINPEVADRLWQLNTTSTGAGAAGAKTGPDKRRRAGDEPDGRDNGVSYSDARAIHEAIKAKLANLLLEEKAGNLVQRVAAERVAFEQARSLRDAVMAVPDRLDSILAAESDPRVVHRLLVEAIEGALRSVQSRTA